MWEKKRAIILRIERQNEEKAEIGGKNKNHKNTEKVKKVETSKSREICEKICNMQKN